MVVKVLKYIFLLILGLALALFVASFVYKDKIIDMVKSKASSHLNAEVDFNDIDISFIKSFPEVQLTIKDLYITGVDTFYNVDLLKAKTAVIDMNITPFFNKEVPLYIKYLSMDKGLLNILVLNDSMANYLITKPSNDTSKFELALDKYEITNTNIVYEDFTLPLKLVGKNTNHSGSGDLATKLFDLDTKTSIDSMTVTFDGMTYLNNVKSSLDAKINVDLNKRTFTLKDNLLKLNKLDLAGNGFVTLYENDGMYVEADFKSVGQSFGNFISAMPYLGAYNTINAKGTADIKGNVKGKYNGVRKVYPAFNIDINIKDGQAQYAGLNKSINNVNGSLNFKSTKSNLSDLLIKIKNFNANVGNESIKADFDVLNGLSDPNYKGFINAKMNLQNWASAFPVDNMKSLKGQVDLDLKFDAKQSDIDKENYPAMIFDGKALCKDFNFNTKDNKAVFIPDMQMNASPKAIMVDAKNMKFGKSDGQLKGNILNPMAYFSDVKNIKGNLEFDADLLDLNEWMSTSTSNELGNENAIVPDVSKYKYNDVDVRFGIKKMLMGQHQIDNMTGKGNIGLENINIESFKATLDKSDIDFAGKLSHIYGYLFENKTLVGEIKVKSKNFNANQFMQNSDATNTSQDSILFRVPDRVSLKMDITADAVKYTDMDMKNFAGAMEVKDKTIIFQNIVTNILGGKIHFDGMYATKGSKPDFNFKLDLMKLEFAKAYKQFVTMQSLAPIANYVSGIFNTTLVMEGQLAKGMIPELSNITAAGFLETLNGFIKGFKPIQELSDKLGIREIANLNLESTKNWFDVKQGLVELKEFTKDIKGINLKMSGSHRLKGEMNYLMFLKIPRTMLQQNKVTSTVEKGWVFLEKEASKKGLNIAQGEFVDLKVSIGGTLKNPKMSIIPLGTSGKTLKEEVKEKVDEKINSVKDSIRKTAESTYNKAKDSLQRIADKKLEEAKDKVIKKAEETVNDVKDKVKEKVEAKVDSTIGKAIPDSIKKKAEDILKEKTGKDLEDIKNKVKDWKPWVKKKKDGGN